ncbi:MAG: methionine synthase [Desulfobacteraceae bacterium]|nr:cobalamin B12-binding domain-containing protein [Desulfobacteraceae bacterium]MBC2756339.1 methionine synthase [Desulfobacteraceae bacterium]
MLQKLTTAITEMNEKEAVAIAEKLLNNGTEPLEVIEACQKAMEVIGRRFSAGECFIPELILAGDMMKQISEKAEPHLKQDVAVKKHGRVIIATVEGDIHDIGKNIVVSMLDANGFDVLDLGVDVPVAKIVETAKEFKPSVVGLSGLLTLAFDPMKAVVAALEEEGLRKNIKVMIGGGMIDEQVRQYTGADTFGANAMDAVIFAKKWTGGKQNVG